MSRLPLRGRQKQRIAKLTVDSGAGKTQGVFGTPASVVQLLDFTSFASLRRYAGPDAPSPEPLERALGGIAERALANEQLLQDIDDALERLVLGVVDQYRPEVAELIARTVEGWDATDASRKIEVQIGRDLQFIRINGTLVGGLVGLVLGVAVHLHGGAPESVSAA